MNPEIISKVLWRHDPANTGCNVCEGAEDEYDRIALKLSSDRKHLQTFENFRAVLVDAFFDEALSPDDLQRCYEEILSLLSNDQWANIENPEYLLLFPNDGPYRVTVKIQGMDRNAVADRQMTVREIDSLIDHAAGNFFSRMEFDERSCEVYRYEIDPIKKILTIRARLKIVENG